MKKIGLRLIKMFGAFTAFMAISILTLLMCHGLKNIVFWWFDICKNYHGLLGAILPIAPFVVIPAACLSYFVTQD